MEVVGTSPSPLASRLFNREMEKSPSPEKQVLDFTYLEAIFDEEVEEIEERKPRDGDKVFSGLPQIAVDQDGTVMQLVSHEYTLSLLKSPPSKRPLSDYSVEAIRRMGITDEKDIQAVAMEGWALQRLRDIQNDIIKQYLDKGYAYVELADDEERYPLPADKKLLPPLP